ncbi:MAG: hypothetical protein PHE47_03170 [Oscillospiraceae bacterium]|nr:hypothetical protein [Oscillospiraceae bacterium]
MPNWNLSNETMLAVGLTAVALVFLLILWLIRRSTNPKVCRRKVTAMLKRYAGIRQFKVLTDLDLEIDGKTAHFDYALIGFYGISFVTCLGESAAYYGQERDEKWSRVDGGSKKSYFPNPLIEGEKGLAVVRQIFAKHNVYNIQMENLVVFAGSRKKTEVYVKASAPALKRKELRQLLGRVKYQKDNSVDVAQLAGLLEEYAKKS